MSLCVAGACVVVADRPDYCVLLEKRRDCETVGGTRLPYQRNRLCEGLSSYFRVLAAYWVALNCWQEGATAIVYACERNMKSLALWLLENGAVDDGLLVSNVTFPC
jgi:hypothetical protein